MGNIKHEDAIIACDRCAYSGSTVGYASHLKLGEPCAYCKGGTYVEWTPATDRGAVEERDRLDANIELTVEALRRIAAGEAHPSKLAGETLDRLGGR